jgi:hypothetical protein
MPSAVSDYARRSARLLYAVNHLSESVGDAVAEHAATIELLNITEKDGFVDSLRYQDSANRDRPLTSVSDSLVAVLFDLQSANVLVAAGAQIRKQENRIFLDDATQQIETTQELLKPAPVAMNYGPNNINSSTAQAAIDQFRVLSNQLLDKISRDVEHTIKLALSDVRKLDPTEILRALGGIGEAVPIVAQATTLVQKGFEKLKRAIEALAELFGKDRIKEIKEQIQQIIEEADLSGRTLLDSVLGVATVKKYIAEILARQSLGASRTDGASNLLPEIDRAFTGNHTLLRGILRAIRLTALLLPLFSFTAPWLAPSLATAYILAIGAALLVGRQYTGEWRILPSVEGVEQIANRIA